jgi:HEAT repeat protein
MTISLFGPPNIKKMKAKRDVNNLVKALGYQKDANVRRAAAKAIGELKDTLAVEPLIAALKDASDMPVCEAGIEALGKIGDARAVEPLIEILHGRYHGWFRREAIEALGHIGGARALEQLVAALKDGIERQSAAGALVEIGAPAVEPLIAALKDSSEDVRKAVMGVLVQIGAAAVEPLITALQDSDKDVRKAATDALGELKDPRAVEPLIVALQDSHKDVRKAAAGALRRLGDTRAVEPLIAVLKDGDEDVCSAVMAALEAIGWKPGMDETGAKYWAVRRVWDQCAAIGPAAWKPLTQALIKENWFVRRDIVQALKKTGWQPDHADAATIFWIITKQVDKLVEIGTPAVEILVEALNFSFTYPTAAKALGEIGDGRAVQPLISVLESGKPKEVWLGGVGFHEADEMSSPVPAAGALVRLGTPAVESLLTLLKIHSENIHRFSFADPGPRILDGFGTINPAYDENRLNLQKSLSVCMYTIQALGNIGDGRAAAPLLDAFNKIIRQSLSRIESNNFSPPIDTFIIALGKMGEPMIEPLLTMLKEEDEKLRGLLALAYAEIGPVFLSPSINLGRDNLLGMAIEILVEIGTPAIEPLMAVLGDEQETVRYAATEALGRIKDPRAVEVLANALRDEHLTVCASAAQALGLIRDPRAVDALIIALGHVNKRVRKSAGSALLNIYRQGDLDGNTRQRILSVRDQVTKPHLDASSHHDAHTEHFDHTCFGMEHKDQPSHSDSYHIHQDEGIGVDFPL